MTRIPMPAALAAAVAADAGRPAVTVDAETRSRQAVWDQAGRVALALRDAGVGHGDLVAILLPNGHPYVAAALGALMLGATPQPLSLHFAPSELDAILALARPAAAVVERDHREVPCPTVVADDLGEGPVELPPAFLEAVAPAWKAPTSGGSTGRPKVIVASDPALIDPDDQELREVMRLPRDGCVVVPGPLHHNAPFTLAMTSLLLGNHVVLSRRFDAAATLRQIERHGASFVLLVPTMMSRILRLPEAERARRDLSSVATVMHAAARCPADVKEGWMDWLGDDVIYEVYGGTEGQAFTGLTGSEWRRHRGSVGRPVAGEVRILTEDGTEAPPGTVGEIYLRPGAAAGPTYRYIGAQSRGGGDGWDSLGDLGWMDEDGYLYLADRRSDLIIRGGANVYPAEVEAALEQHPRVREAVVVGLPDEDLGATVHALVSAEAGVTAGELNAFLTGRLSRYKCPASYELVEERLRDDGGKVRRSAVRERFLERQGSARQKTIHPD